MKILVDTDAFCKLGVAGLLGDATGLLGAQLPECGRLPALPHMLRRGRLPKLFGTAACEDLLSLAEKVPALVVRPSEDTWLNCLTPVAGIDPGEAQLFAAAAEGGLIVLSGDKRALRELRAVAVVAQALAGRIVVLEAILLALCNRHGSETVRSRVLAAPVVDTAMRACFSMGNSDPCGALLSYYRSLAAELDPVALWNPDLGGTV